MVLAVNISERQHDLVVPFLRENSYTFKALKGTSEVRADYEVTGVPSEYVIDRQGRVVTKVRLNSDARERQFEELLQSVLGS